MHLCIFIYVLLCFRNWLSWKKSRCQISLNAGPRCGWCCWLSNSFSRHCLDTSINQQLHLRFMVGCCCVWKKNTNQLQTKSICRILAFLSNQRRDCLTTAPPAAICQGPCGGCCFVTLRVCVSVSMHTCVCVCVCVWRRETNRVRTRGQPGCRPSVPGEYPSGCFFQRVTKEKQNREGGEVWKEFIFELLYPKVLVVSKLSFSLFFQNSLIRPLYCHQSVENTC